MPQTFTSPFTGNVIQPTDVSYYELTFDTDQDLYWPAVVNPTQVPAARIIDCYPEAADLHVNLPAGGQGSVGSDILFRNFGDETFSIVDFSGDSSVLIQPGESKYFYLVDNSTEDGLWENVTFGTGTSSADAATLQGSGLTTINGQLATSNQPVIVTAAPTFSETSRGLVYVWTAGAGTLTLPAAASVSAGWYIGFRNNGTGTLTVLPSGSAQINDGSSVTVNPGDSGFIVLQKSTGNYYTVGFTTPTNVTFTSATYDVDSIVGNDLSLVSFAPIIQSYVGLTGTRTDNLNVELPAVTQLYVLINNTGNSAYNIEFTITGSTSPAFVLANGSVATIISDGNTIYAVTQSTTNIFYATDGSAGSPSFSFVNDDTTGLYLESTDILGISAGGVQMALVDNSNPSLPVFNITARLKADLINGGTF